MRKLIMEQWVSLDGYATDANNQLTFFENLSGDENKYSDAEQLKFLDTIDTILLGRKTYELFVDFWPTEQSKQEVIAPKLNEIKKIVFSNTLAAAPWGKWPALEINKDATNSIKKLKEQQGKNMVIWGSLSLSQQLIKENLIDEYHIQLCPVTTGGGRALFPDTEIMKKLKLVELRKYDTGVVFLKYKI